MAGTIEERGTQHPVEGALVLLLDEEGAQRAGFLTNAAGRFLLRAPGPGRYRVRAERIGYEVVESDPVDVGGAETVIVELNTSPSAIRLEGVEVRGEQRCALRPEEGLTVAQVWDEARKALTVQQWTESTELYRFRLTHYQRELDPYSFVVRSEERTTREATSSNPVRSLPAEDLLSHGFIRPAEDGGFFYYGPDAGVLLSDAFLDTHCFKLTEEDSSPELIGLSFEPVGHRPEADILGTLWVERSTARLHSLDFTYDRAPWEEALNVARGHVEFREMPNGAWIVSRWWIRMPEMARAQGGLRESRPVVRVASVREVGEEVARITASSDRPESGGVADPANRGSIEGVVWDSVRHGPVQGATVFLSGTSYHAETGPEGRFRLEGVPLGRYRLTFAFPYLDSLGVFPSAKEVEIRPGETAQTTLGVPSLHSLVRALCPDGPSPDSATAVTGRVTWEEAAGGPPPGTLVRLEWSRYVSPGMGVLTERKTALEVEVQPNGRYRACGVPPETLVSATVRVGRRAGEATAARTPDAGVLVLDLKGRSRLP